MSLNKTYYLAQKLKDTKNNKRKKRDKSNEITTLKEKLVGSNIVKNSENLSLIFALQVSYELN